MTEISKEPRILSLEISLNASIKNFREMERIFVDHTKSRFTEMFVRRELLNLTFNPEHVVRNVIGQVNISVINSRNFDYTVQIRPPLRNTQGYLKWMGVGQVLVVKGAGNMIVRVLQVPEHIHINHFEKDIQYEVLEERELHNGDSISCQGPHRILDIVEVDAAIVIESLTIKNNETDIFWTFDNNARSFIAESAKVTTSRLVNMLNVAALTGNGVPEKLYEAIFEHGDYNIQLKAIQSMLSEKNHSAFDRIQEAIESPNETLSEGAHRILDRLVSHKI